jgi:hypothetical protein
MTDVRGYSVERRGWENDVEREVERGRSVEGGRGREGEVKRRKSREECFI